MAGEDGDPRSAAILRSVVVGRPRALREMLATDHHMFGIVAPAEGPLERFVARVNDDPERPEVAAARARGAGRVVAWGEPVPVKRTELLRWNVARGRESVIAVRSDPTLRSTLQIGSWFASRWRVRAIRRLVLALPGALPFAVAHLCSFLPSPDGARLALDIAFWTGVRSASTREEWDDLTRRSYVALCYHRITPESGPGQERMSLPPTVFRRQMRLLRWLGYQALTSAEVVAFHHGATGIGRRRYALTADDGFEDCVAELTASGAAQLFVPTAAPGQNAWWTEGGRVADWPRLAGAAATGVAIGSHGRRHRPLVELSDDELQDELGGSHTDLAANLPVVAPVLAYPNGNYDARVRAAAVEAGYVAAYTTDPGRNGTGLDAFCLRRVTPKAWDSRLSFLFRVVTGEPVPDPWDARRRRAASRRSIRQRVESRANRVVRRMSPGRRYRGAIVERELRRRFGDHSEIRLLDAGSENGIVATTIAKRHPAWLVVGVDLNAEALREGLSWAAENRADNVHFVRADLTNLLRDDGFDAAIAVDCLTEVPDDDGALVSITRSLRPGGVLVVHSPVAGWRPVLPSSGRHWPRAVRRGYDPEVLTAKLGALDLVVDEVRPTFRAVGHLAQEIRDRHVKGKRLVVQLVAFPFLIGAVWLERVGLTVGRPRAVLVVAHRPTE
jgi:peptidoglycan/xylan/chitin deacetylase (PgdA/CDA1 family)